MGLERFYGIPFQVSFAWMCIRMAFLPYYTYQQACTYDRGYFRVPPHH